MCRAIRPNARSMRINKASELMDKFDANIEVRPTIKSYRANGTPANPMGNHNEAAAKDAYQITMRVFRVIEQPSYSAVYKTL